MTIHSEAAHSTITSAGFIDKSGQSQSAII